MDQVSSKSLLGAALMLGAGLAYAALNVATQWAGMTAQIPSTVTAFWQYLIALLLALPWILRQGRKALATRHPGLHLLRVGISALGVQLWVYALAHEVPIWQGIALLMTSPFFVIAGAGLFLRERITPARIAATLMGFVGATIILAPWSAAFTWLALLPVAASALWAGTTILTKYLTRDEEPEAVTVYLLLLLTPVNAAFLIGGGTLVPNAAGWPVLVVAGVLTALSQYLLTRAYAVADAAYLQPFDDLKLPLNVLLAWLVFAAAPTPNFWPGAALILAASLFIMQRESRRAPPAAEMPEPAR